MIPRKLGARAGMFAVMLLSAAAEAHHSYAQFDRCTSYTIEGDIDAVDWINPHIVFSLKSAETTYRVEWFALQQLARVGLQSGVIKTGDHVLLTGSKSRDPAVKMLALLTAISRPSDGWTWSRPTTDVCRTTDRPAAAQ